MTGDDIPGAKVQMNDNLVPCNRPRRLRETKLGQGYHSNQSKCIMGSILSRARGKSYCALREKKKFFLLKFLIL